MLLALATTASAGPIAPVGMSDLRCRLGAAQPPFLPTLPGAARVLAETGRLTVVALGSSSTAGAGAGPDDRSYPALLQAELRRRLPDRDVTVVNKGAGGQSAYDMVQRMEADVFEEKPALVIWQTAANDAIRNIGEERFAKILRKGIARLQGAGIDLVLMDLQWLPREERYPLYDDYRKVLLKTAAEQDVPVFPRYAIMRNWARSKQFTAEEIVGMDGMHLVDAGYRCLALRLADGIAASLTGRKSDFGEAPGASN